MAFSSSFEHLKSVLLRGGRMTKVAGRAASFAPQLGLALFASAPLVTAGSTAVYALTPAICTAVGAPGTYQCSGSATTTQSLSPPSGEPLTVTTTEQISIITTSGDALDLSNSSGDPDISFTDTYMSTITGDQKGIEINQNGLGAVTLTTTGHVSGTNGEGIDLDLSSRGTGGTLQVVDVTGGSDGINVHNDSSGAISITASGQVTGTADHGIYAYNGAGTDIAIQAASVTGGTHGIYAKNYYGTGAVSITASGDVTGQSRAGIYAYNYVDGTSLTIQVATVSGARIGIYAGNDGTGALSITATGQVTGTSSEGIWADNSSYGTDLTIQAASAMGGRNGIRANQDGSGALSITATGAVTAQDGDGIYANNSSNGTDLIISVAAVTGRDDGINAFNNYNSGRGGTSVTATGDVVGQTGDGIDAYDLGTGLTVQAAAVSGAGYGIKARKSGGAGSVHVTATGTVTGGAQDGILATNSGGGDLTVQAASVMGANNGIKTQNAGGALALSITATGDVTGTAADGIYAQNLGTALTIQVGAVTGGNRGIYAKNVGTGALSITTTGDVTGTNGEGIFAYNLGSGALSVTSTGGAVTGDGYGVLARNGLSGTDLTVSVVNVNAMNGIGVRANNSGSGSLSLTASGAVVGNNSHGISAVNSTYSTDLTIQAASVTGSGAGIHATNYGTGTLSVTTSGTVAGGTYGIRAYANNVAGTLSIATTGDVGGGVDGIRAETQGTGTRIAVSGTVMGGTGAGIVNGGSGSHSITLNSGASVSATSGTAILDRGGDTTVRVNTGSAVMGSIELSDGSDTIVLSGGDVSGVTSFDGGFTPATYLGVDTLRVAAPTELAGGKVTNFSHLEIVDGGTLSLTDNMISIGDGSAGTGVFVRSGGTFSVAADSTVNVTGDTIFEAGGRLHVGIASDSQAGTLSTAGALTFESGSEVYADVTQGIQLTAEGAIEVANATKGLSDNGLAVNDNSALVDFSHEVRNGDSLFLIVEQILNATDVTATTGASSNARDIAAALDVLIDSAPADNPIVTYLAQFPVEEQAAQLLQLVKDTLPSESGGDGAATVASTDLVLDLITDRLTGGGSGIASSGARQTGVAAGEQLLGGPGNWALWGRAGASFVEFEPSGVNGFDADTYGLSVGFDGDVAQDLRAGVAVFYSSTVVDEIGVAANSNQDIEGYGVLFYGVYRPGDFYVNATAGFGLNEYDSKRRAAGGVNTANYDGTQFMGRVELGKIFTDGALELSPHVGLRFNQVSIDGYTEAGPLPTTVGSQDVTSLRGVLGLSGRYTHVLDDGSKLIPEAYVRGLQELADPSEAITGNVVGGGSFISQTTERDKFSYAAGAGLAYEMDDQVSLSFMYDGEFQTDYQEHSLTAAIRFQF